MYDELVKELRDPCPHENCVVCQKAADAIEELSKDRDNWKATAKEEREAYWHWFDQYQKDVPRWIPVTERLPKYGERVLVFGGVTMYVAYYDKNRYGGESWHKLNSKSHYCNPTHWMPLPTPPKEG